MSYNNNIYRFLYNVVCKTYGINTTSRVGYKIGTIIATRTKVKCKNNLLMTRSKC